MVDQSALEVFESFAGYTLPREYAEYLKTNAGETPNPSAFEVPDEGDTSVQYFFPLVSKTKTDTLAYKLKNYTGRVPEEMLPIGADPGGNLILLRIKGPKRGAVFFWDHELEADDEEQPYYDNIKPLADSFPEFLASLHEFQEEEDDES